MGRAAVSLLILAACGGAPDAPPNADGVAAMVGVDPANPATCEACHGAVVAEWRESMHARAHHDADPIFGAMRQLRMAREGEAVAGQCAPCHSPLDLADPTSAASRAGVACGACHAVAAVDTSDGKKGAHALVMRDDGVLAGPHDIAPGTPAPHGVGTAAPHLVDGETICLACHDATANPQGVPACTTGPESRAMEGGAPCVECHMPRVPSPSGAASPRDSHRSHAFLGPHRAWLQSDVSFLEGAVALDGRLEGDALTVTLTNQAGHGVPTGFPGRTIVLSAQGRDGEGSIVWRNVTNDPMAESPESVLGKVYVDAEGNPTMPPYAAALKRDSRLTPGEARSITYSVPPEVVAVELRLAYHLAPPPAFDAWGLEEAPEAVGKVIARLTISK